MSLWSLKKRKNVRLLSTEAIDLVSKMLEISHEDRITPRDALKHPYFDPIRELMDDDIIKPRS